MQQQSGQEMVKYISTKVNDITPAYQQVSNIQNISGSKFWRFDPTLHPPVKSAYPKPISNWQGLPNGLDAAFKDKNGYTYFFKDNAYYRFNDRAFAVENTNPAFPRSTAHWWFGCKEAPRGTIGTLGFISEADESDDSNNSPGDFDSSLDAGTDHFSGIA